MNLIQWFKQLFKKKQSASIEMFEKQLIKMFFGPSSMKISDILCEFFEDTIYEIGFNNTNIRTIEVDMRKSIEFRDQHYNHHIKIIIKHKRLYFKIHQYHNYFESYFDEFITHLKETEYSYINWEERIQKCSFMIL